MDMEWVPDHILQNALDVFKCFDVPLTIFGTHNTKVDMERYDLGIHPNFQKDEQPEEVISKNLQMYPQANGVRTHGLYISTDLRKIFVNNGLKYESNYLIYKKIKEPFEMPSGTIQYPIYWEDDIWFTYEKSEVDPKSLIEPSGTKVFSFHPNHIAFNTPTKQYYQNHKGAYYRNETNIQELQYNGYGTRTALVDILEYLQDKNEKMKTMEEAYAGYNE